MVCLGLLFSCLGCGQPRLLLFPPSETVPLRLRSQRFLELMEGDGWVDGEFRLAGVSVLSGNKVNPKRLEGLWPAGCTDWGCPRDGSLMLGLSITPHPGVGPGTPSQCHCLCVLGLQGSISLSQHHLLPRVCVASSLAGDMALWDPWEGTFFMHGGFAVTVSPPMLGSLLVVGPVKVVRPHSRHPWL